ncbi:hypothetical protein ACPA9J_11385 [Pseudomonas aeruginosa]
MGGYGVQANPRWRPWRAVALIFWSLVWVVSIKYKDLSSCVPTTREGGVMAQSAPGAPGGDAVRQAADFRGGCRPDRRGALFYGDLAAESPRRSRYCRR